MVAPPVPGGAAALWLSPLFTGGVGQDQKKRIFLRSCGGLSREVGFRRLGNELGRWNARGHPTKRLYAFALLPKISSGTTNNPKPAWLLPPPQASPDRPTGLGGGGNHARQTPLPRWLSCRTSQVHSPPSQGSADVITAAGIADRIRRLEALTLALAREGQLLRAAQDPLLYAERRDYLSAIGRATVGLGREAPGECWKPRPSSGSTATGRGRGGAPAPTLPLRIAQAVPGRARRPATGPREGGRLDGVENRAVVEVG